MYELSLGKGFFLNSQNIWDENFSSGQNNILVVQKLQPLMVPEIGLLALGIRCR